MARFSWRLLCFELWALARSPYTLVTPDTPERFVLPHDLPQKLHKRIGGVEMHSSRLALSIRLLVSLLSMFMFGAITAMAAQA
jgi:hypothetical protein